MMDVIKVTAAAREYGLCRACAASKYRAQLGRAAEFHPPQTAGKQIKFCIKAELCRNSSAFENTER